MTRSVLRGGSVWLFIGLALIAAGAPLLAPALPSRTEPGAEFRAPLQSNVLGTDHLGRDEFGLVIWATRHTLASAAVAVAVALLAGGVMGIVAGGVGGFWEQLIQRFIDALLAFPGLLLAMAVVAVMGQGLIQVALAVGLSLAPPVARLTRATVRAVRGEEFLLAARALGGGRWHILRSHMLPMILPQLISYGALVFAWALLNVAALDFLGLTGDPSMPTWGRLLEEGRRFLGIAPWIAIAPGVALTTAVLIVNRLSAHLQRVVGRYTG